MCVCSFWISSGFFYSGNSSTYFKVCVDLGKKSDRTRCLAFSILEYNINSNSKSQSERKRFGFLKEERNSVVIRRVNIGDPAYRIV